MGKHEFFDFATPETEMFNTTKLKILEAACLQIKK